MNPGSVGLVPVRESAKTYVSSIRNISRDAAKRGGERAAAMYTLIGTAKLNDVDPQVWLRDVPDRIADLPQARLHGLLSWNWKAERQQAMAA